MLDFSTYKPSASLFQTFYPGCVGKYKHLFPLEKIPYQGCGYGMAGMEPEANAYKIELRPPSALTPADLELDAHLPVSRAAKIAGAGPWH
jgi:hypothetical protein